MKRKVTVRLIEKEYINSRGLIEYLAEKYIKRGKTNDKV